MCDLPAVNLRLRQAKEMYETWTVGDVDVAGVDYTKWPELVARPTSGQNLSAPETDEEKDYIMFVHGWNFYFGTAHADSPGKRWAATGPALLLGYNQAGPSDRNGGLEIIKRFFGSDPVAATAAGRVDAWRATNETGSAWNACAIIPNDSYYYFKYKSFQGHKIGGAVWTKVNKLDW
jgi:hypothetical protein